MSKFKFGDKVTHPEHGRAIFVEANDIEADISVEKTRLTTYVLVRDLKKGWKRK